MSLPQPPQFYHLEINHTIVATAGLRPHSPDWTEIIKVCVDPAYQGLGLSSLLLSQLITTSTAPHLFALTVNPKMGSVFTRLQFQPVDRRTLCPQWQAQYDFTRPSQAYLRSGSGGQLDTRRLITPPSRKSSTDNIAS